MGIGNFAITEFIIVMVNLFLLGIIILVPIWLIRKIKSIDKTLKEISQKLDK